MRRTLAHLAGGAILTTVVLTGCAATEHDADDCSRVNWTTAVPTDVNADGVIDCGSDVELGA